MKVSFPGPDQHIYLPYPPHCIYKHVLERAEMATTPDDNPWLQRIAGRRDYGAHKDVLAETSEENLDFVWKLILDIFL